MEDILGCRLFNRTKRHVRLTPEGQSLIPIARRILSEIDELGIVAKQAKNPFSGTLRLGATALIGKSKIFHLLVKLKKKKNLKMRFVEKSAIELLSDLKSHFLDVAFIPYIKEIESSEISYCVLDKDEMVLCEQKI
jgi:LysR family hydrogen peroxide-inducible transcriptional activator